MRHGFVKVAAATPDIRVADVAYNVEQIKKQMDEADEQGAKVVVFPELCLTGYTCGDLFGQAILLKAVKEGLKELTEYTKEKDGLYFVGAPAEVEGKLYNVAAAMNQGDNSLKVPGRRERYSMTEEKFLLDHSFYLRHSKWKNW